MAEPRAGSDARRLPATATVQGALKTAAECLQRAGIDQPKLAAEILVASALNCPRLELYLRLNEKLAPAQIEAVRQGTRRLQKHEPIQYVIGRTDFMGHILKCDQRGLVPRPETEELVEFVIGHKPFRQIESPAVIDLGTGSGCIVVSLALRNKNGKYWAVDVSRGATALAKENARVNNVAGIIKFLTADFTGRKMPSGMDAVVSNPPYVRTSDFNRLEKNVRLWEPRRALDGGQDGLDIIRPLIKKAHEILKPGRFLFLEIGFDQWKQVRQLLAGAGFRQSFLRRDRAGHPRLVMAVK